MFTETRWSLQQSFKTERWHTFWHFTHSHLEKLTALISPHYKKKNRDMDIYNTLQISYNSIIHFSPSPRYADISYWHDTLWNVRRFRCDAHSPPVPFVAKWWQPRQYSPDVRRCAEVWVFTDSFLHTFLILMPDSIHLSQRRLDIYIYIYILVLFVVVFFLAFTLISVQIWQFLIDILQEKKYYSRLFKNKWWESSFIEVWNHQADYKKNTVCVCIYI